MPPHVAALRSSAHLIDSLWPCDVVGFVQMSRQAEVRDDLALSLILAWVRVPSCRQHILAQPQGKPSSIGWRDLHHALHSALSVSSPFGARHKEEGRQLGSAGARRTLGVVACARALGVTEGRDTRGAPAQTREKRRRVSRKTSVVETCPAGASTRGDRNAGSLGKLARVAVLAKSAARLPEITDGQSLTSAIEILNAYLDSVEEALGMATLKTNSYTRGYLLWTMLVAHLAHAQDIVDWSTVTLDMLGAAGPHQASALDTFPSNWNAPDLSEFVFGRPDWAIFMGMLAFLWKDALSSGDHPDVTAIVKSDHFQKAAKRHVSEWGFSAHPYVLLLEQQ